MIDFESTDRQMNTLVILGAGEHGEVVADAALCTGRWSSIVWYDDDQSRRPFLGEGVAGSIDSFFRTSSRHEVAIGIGSGEARQRLCDRLASTPTRLPKIVHPRAFVSAHARVDDGVVVLAGSVVNVGATLSRGVIVNTCASVDHHSRVGQFAHVCPGAHLAGNVIVGDLAWIGIGSSVIEGVSIGERSVIGAGAAVTRDVPDGMLAIGVPAKIRGPAGAA